MVFRNIKIANFRGIKHAEIKDLGRVNLFVGNNNCGKTSVLEAVFLLTGMSKPNLSLNINIFRDYIAKDIDGALSVLFHNMDFDNQIKITGEEPEKAARSLTIFPIFEDLETLKITDSDAPLEVLLNQEDAKLKGLDFHFEIKNESKTSSYKSSLREGVVSKPNEMSVGIQREKEYKESILAAFLNTKSSFLLAKETLVKIIENKQKEFIISSLQKIEPRLKDIEFLNTQIVADIGLKKLIPIQMLGDGIRKLLSILVYLYKCKNGILLIDEIDNGLHYSSMPSLWQAVLSCAKDFNVQVFASTHNIDSLKALKEVLEQDKFKDEQKEANCYKLLRLKTGELRAFNYTFDEFQATIDSETELR